MTRTHAGCAGTLEATVRRIRKHHRDPEADRLPPPDRPGPVSPENEVSSMIRRSLRHPAAGRAAGIAALAAAALLGSALPVHADGDLVVIRARLHHPQQPSAAAPSPAPGRDVIELDPVPAPRPPRIPGELAPAAATTQAAPESGFRAWMNALRNGWWRVFAH
jgi:hypothetical protein